jgi:CheY-like chemotaxis protein
MHGTPGSKGAILDASAHEPGRRVLIVEDNPDCADSLRMLLQFFGHEVWVARTGPDGVRLARARRPDVVLCDIGLPGLDGFGVAAALRQDPATAAAHLVAITGYGSDQVQSRCREVGFDRYFTKPVDPDVLIKLLAAGPTP